MLALRVAAEQPLRDRTFQTLVATQAHVMGMAHPLILTCAAGWEARESCAAFARAGGAGMNWGRVRTIDGAVAANNWMSELCAMRLAAVRAWRDTLSDADLRAMAFTLDYATNTPDSELEALQCEARVCFFFFFAWHLKVLALPFRADASRCARIAAGRS